MRVLRDECLPKRLKRELVGHDTRTVAEVIDKAIEIDDGVRSGAFRIVFTNALKNAK